MRTFHGISWLALAASACVGGDLPPRPSADPEPDAGPDADAPMCPASQETNDCFRCTDENCCVEYEACQADSRCTTYYKACLPECTATKSYDECVIECSSSNGAGHAKFATYFACTNDRCFAECANNEDDPCVRCTQMMCREESVACVGDSYCQVLDSCLNLCFASAADTEEYEVCAQQCLQHAPPPSQERQVARLTCEVLSCSATCELAEIQGAFTAGDGGLDRTDGGT